MARSEDYDLQDVGDCLIEWVSTFNLGNTDVKYDLTDGLVVEQVLSIISPQHFTLPQTKTNMTENWVLRTTNLKKIIKELEEFYKVVLGANADIKSGIDAMKVCKYKELEDTVQLWSLVLGTVLGSDRRSEWIDNITKLPESSQGVLMTLMQSVINRYSLSEADSTCSETEGSLLSAVSPPRSVMHHSLRQELQQALQQHNSASVKAERLQQVVKELESQNQALREEMDRIREEKERLAAKVVEGIEIQVRGGFHSETVQRQEEENKDKEPDQTLLQKDREIEKLQKNVKQAERVIEENRELRDELDLLRARVGKVEEMELQLKKLTKKLLDMGNTKRQAEIYKNQTKQLVDQVGELQKQVEVLENQNSGALKLKEEIASLSSKTRQLEMELQTSKQQVQEKQETIALLHSQRDQLQERCHKLTCEKESARSSMSHTPTERSLDFVIPPDSQILKEQISRLQSKLESAEKELNLKLRENEELKNNIVLRSNRSNTTSLIQSSCDAEISALKEANKILTEQLEERKFLSACVYRIGWLYMKEPVDTKLKAPHKEQPKTSLSKMRRQQMTH